jgi:hypothetical protein
VIFFMKQEFLTGNCINIVAIGHKSWNFLNGIIVFLGEIRYYQKQLLSL